MATVTAEPSVSLSEATSRFLNRAGKMMIDGQWRAAQSGETFEVYNPATEEPIAHCAAGDKADIDAAVRAARQAFESGPWSRISPSERGRMIWRLGDLLEKNAAEFAELETLDNGKPLAVAKAADLPLAVDMFRYMAGWATKIHGQTIPISSAGGEYLSFTLREPIGVVGQIIPWNFPLLMAAWKLGPALAAGCTIVLKPAEQTPLTALRLGELVQEAGFPAGVVNIVTGLGETAGAALAAHPDVDKVAFTGSTEVGRLIVQAAGRSNLKKVTLELGGKSPNVVFADADLEAAIPGAASAIFFNHGQCCCAGSRLFVQKKVFEQVVEGVAEEAKKIHVGSGFDSRAQMGPLVSREQFDRVCGYIEAGQKEGAHMITGGNRVGKQGYFVEPTIFTQTQPEMKVVREEIFGPVVTAMPFDEADEIVPKANDTPYGLAAAVWTRDIGKANRMAKRIKAGTVWINCYNVFDAALPFGGYKESGWGREMGLAAVELYTEVKAVTTKLG
jgi:phenylacetaldehyde dehydrogenase